MTVATVRRSLELSRGLHEQKVTMCRMATCPSPSGQVDGTTRVVQADSQRHHATSVARRTADEPQPTRGVSVMVHPGTHNRHAVSSRNPLPFTAGRKSRGCINRSVICTNHGVCSYCNEPFRRVLRYDHHVYICTLSTRIRFHSSMQVRSFAIAGDAQLRSSTRMTWGTHLCRQHCEHGSIQALRTDGGVRPLTDARFPEGTYQCAYDQFQLNSAEGQQQFETI